MLQKTHEQVFLDKFTEEMILHLRRNNYDQEKQAIEEERRKKSIEAEKLRMKIQDKIIPISPAPKPVAPPPTIKNPIIPISRPIPRLPILRQPPVNPINTNQMQNQNKPSDSSSQAKLTEVSFGKIMLLIQDSTVRYIECPGEDKAIIIKKAGQTIKTQLSLKKQEILEIIKSFSEKARIPLIEGMLIAKIENIEISAVVSEEADSSFIIKKSLEMPLQNPREESRQRLLKSSFIGTQSNKPLSPINMPPRKNPFPPLNAQPSNPIQPNSPL